MGSTCLTDLLHPNQGPRSSPPPTARPRGGPDPLLAVHLAVLCSAAAALGTLQLLDVRVAYHTVVGLVFVGWCSCTWSSAAGLSRTATQIVRARTFVERRIRLALSDLLLLLITRT